MILGISNISIKIYSDTVLHEYFYNFVKQSFSKDILTKLRFGLNIKERTLSIKISNKKDVLVKPVILTVSLPHTSSSYEYAYFVMYFCGLSQLVVKTQDYRKLVNDVNNLGLTKQDQLSCTNWKQLLNLILQAKDLC